MSSDHQEIANLVEDEPEMSKYRELEWRYVQDIGQGNYSDGVVRFDTQQQIQSFITWKKAYVELQLLFTNGGTALTSANTLLALRNGVSSIFYDSLITMNNITVSNNQYTNLMAQVRHMLEHSAEWEANIADEEHYAVDDTEFPSEINASVALTKDSAGTKVVGESTTAIGATNAGDESANVLAAIQEADRDKRNVNRGFAKRVDLFKQNAVLEAGNYKLRVRVPLRRINKVFDSLDMPLNNIRMQMNLGLSLPARGTQIKMYTHCGNSAAPPPADLDAGGCEALTVSVDPGYRPRLYFPVVQYDAETWSAISPMLDPALNPNGRIKHFSFPDHKVFRYTTAVGEGQPFQFAITPGMRNVKRVIVCAFGQQNVQGGADGSVAINALENHQCVGYYAPIALDQLQLQVDNKPFYPSPIDNDAYAYQLVKEAMMNDGAYEDGTPLLTYKRWKNRYRYYVLDIQRNPNVVADSSKPVSLYLTANRAAYKPAAGAVSVASQYADPTLTNAVAPAPQRQNLMDLYAFVEYDVDLKLNLINGKPSVNNQ